MVADVARYPEFVPWITSMRFQAMPADSAGRSRVRAEAGVGFSFLKERFTTDVIGDPVARSIQVRLVSGPFRRLENDWRFEPHPRGAKVVFDIDFEFRSRLLATLLRANFTLAVDRLISCFETRARALYGSQSDRGPEPSAVSRDAPETA